MQKLASKILLTTLLVIGLSNTAFAITEIECEEMRAEWQNSCANQGSEEEISRECIFERRCVLEDGKWTFKVINNRYSSEFFDVTDKEDGLVAPGQSVGPESRFTGPNGERSIQNIAIAIFTFLAQMVSLVALIVFIAGTFFLITASGEENQITKGKDALKYSIMGLLFALFSYTIVVFIQSVFF